jgi:hypothetical protein
MEPYMRHWEVTVRHAKDCADFLMASRDALKECSSVFRYLERDFKDRLLMHFSSGSGGAPWVELEAALRRFAMACPTESLVDHTKRLSEAFVKLKEGLLDVEDAFGLYIATGPTSVEGHRRRYRYLVEFKTRHQAPGVQERYGGQSCGLLECLEQAAPGSTRCWGACGERFNWSAGERVLGAHRRFSAVPCQKGAHIFDPVSW